MNKKLLLILSLFFSATAGKAQMTMPVQYAELMEKLAKAVPTEIRKEKTSPNSLLEFARTMLGVPYRYASGSPERGFDCSGFVSYVFQNFGFKVPRSSVEFARTGTPKKLSEARIGDVLIFTGSNPKVRSIGHVGIIYSIDDDSIKFIHSTSGKANGVTITNFDGYYKSRFIKVVSIL